MILNQVPIPGLTDQQPDTVARKAEEGWSALKAISVDDLINKLASTIVEFAIHLGVAILVFYAGRFIINKLYGLTSNILHRRNVDMSLTTFVLSLVRMALYFILVVTVIGIIGINTSSFIAIFASAGVAIGMALSGTLQNFAGGVLILLLKPYKVGDYIEAQGYAGVVKEIQIFSTIICTPDNKSIIVPNGPLSTGSINNWSREAFRRVDWTVGISYGDNVDTARKVIQDILKADGRIIEDDSVGHTTQIALAELADSSVNLSIKAWVKSSDYWDVYYSMNEKFYNELPLHGLSFPFPQLDIHLPRPTGNKPNTPISKA